MRPLLSTHQRLVDIICLEMNLGLLHCKTTSPGQIASPINNATYNHAYTIVTPITRQIISFLFFSNGGIVRRFCLRYVRVHIRFAVTCAAGAAHFHCSKSSQAGKLAQGICSENGTSTKNRAAIAKHSFAKQNSAFSVEDCSLLAFLAKLKHHENATVH